MHIHIHLQEAQNKVAAFALYQLFPDLPLCQMLEKPYSLFVEKWQQGEGTNIYLTFSPYILRYLYSFVNKINTLIHLFIKLCLMLSVFLFQFECTEEFSTKAEDTEDARRADFVDSLLDSSSCQPVASVDVWKTSINERPVEPQNGEVIGDSYAHKVEETFSENTGTCLDDMIFASYLLFSSVYRL